METVLCHGLGEDSRQWEGVRGALPFSTRCPDLLRLAGEGGMDYAALYKRFEGACDAMEGRLRLCGLSLGGVLALDYASRRRERVESLVLVGTPYRIPRAAFLLQGLVFRLMPPGAFQEMGVSRQEALSLMESMGRLDIPAMAAGIRCRTLVLCGERDRANRPAAAELCRAIPGSMEKHIPGAGHQVEVDAPALLARELTAFWDA